ncbi:MAG: phosphatidylglycerophosphatase A [Lentisphaerae bacterium]|nr:phosphatidylglycerophosphatase A [Lentisphaerota bacterium]
MDKPEGSGRKLVVALATGFGLGRSPLASGTVGTLPGIGLAVGLKFLECLWLEAAAAAAMCLLAVPICTVAERFFGTKDDRRIVADEYLTFPLCVIGLPLTPGLLAVAFLTNRFFDVLKPFPARRAQDLPEGWGIVTDDVLSCCYSWLVNWGVYRFFFAS